MKNEQTIGFDADDTLWENEVFFHKALIKFKKLHPHIKDPDEAVSYTHLTLPTTPYV